MRLLMFALLPMVVVTTAGAAPLRCIDEAKAYGASPSDNGYSKLSLCVASANATVPGVSTPVFGKPIAELSPNEVGKLQEWITTYGKLASPEASDKMMIQWLDSGKLAISGKDAAASLPSIELKTTQ